VALIALFAGPEVTLIASAARFLDIILLILMIARPIFLTWLSPCIPHQ